MVLLGLKRLSKTLFAALKAQLRPLRVSWAVKPQTLLTLLKPLFNFKLPSNFFLKQNQPMVISEKMFSVIDFIPFDHLLDGYGLNLALKKLICKKMTPLGLEIGPNPFRHQPNHKRQTLPMFYSRFGKFTKFNATFG